MRDEGVLWLAFEQVTHPDGVRYAARNEEVEFAVETLRRERIPRVELSRALRNYLTGEERRGVFSRRSVPMRGANGLYRLVPWRMAKWLMNALLVEGSVREGMLQRMEGWLGRRGEGTVLRVERSFF